MTTASGERSDDDLLAAARDGDRAAIDALVVRYQPVVYRFGLKMCGNVEDARDILQDTLLAMARSLGGFRADASLSTWLYTIARRFCMRKRRTSKFAPRGEESLDALPADRRDGLAAPTRNPEQELAGQELQDELNAAIAALDPPQREVLVLRDVEGLSARDVAQVLGLGVEAVKSRLHRARLAVRQRLAPVLGRAAEPGKEGPCRDVLTLFSRHLEGDIDPRTCADMEAHVEACPRCRDACESLKRALALCRNAPTPEVPDSVARSVRDAIRAHLAHEETSPPEG